ncbi:MAG TPA: hypothetical protein VKX17_18910 [Planctomycetota bacterium]|nr:hypothetical protein [Planctomycetota bacterium]
MINELGLGTLEEAAEANGLSRDAVYRVSVKLQRVKAQRVVARINGRLRARWMVNMQEIHDYFNQTTLVDTH